MLEPQKYCRGFTLVELVIAVSVFSALIMILGGMTISAIKFQRTALATQAVLDNSRSVMEIMGRDIRLAAKDDDGNCVASRTNYEVTGGNELKFENDRGKCTRYYVLNGELKRDIDAVPETLTAAETIRVDSLNFAVFGENGDDKTQPRVLVRLKVSATEADLGVNISLQTTLTQRELDVQ